MSDNDRTGTRKIVVKNRLLKRSPALLLASLVGAAIGLGYAIYTDPHRPLPPPPPAVAILRVPVIHSDIGLQLRSAPDGAAVFRVFPGTAAARAGLQPGDIIIAVDGVTVGHKTLADIAARLRGPAGSVVVLTCVRGTGAPVQVAVTRPAAKNEGEKH